MGEGPSEKGVADPHGLLESLESTGPRKIIRGLAEVKLAEISRFRDSFGFLPNRDSDSPLEKRLSKRLSVAHKDSRFESILDSEKLLLPNANLDFGSGDSPNQSEIEIDPFGLLAFRRGDHLGQLRNVEPSDRIQPHYYSSRRRCKNFEDFEPRFNKVVEDLKDGTRELIEFSPVDLRTGSFAVLSGLLLLLEDAALDADQKYFASGQRARVDGRTKTIFSNGTESTILYRSLVKALQRDGLLVSEKNTSDRSKKPLEISKNDTDTGFVYVVKSSREDLLEKTNLFKIGFTTVALEQRLKNAENEPAYLYSPVRLVATYRCINLSSRSLESLLHRVFKDGRVEIIATDGNGIKHKPQEWFEVPFSQIDKAIELTLEGRIESYTYDSHREMLIRKAS